MKKLYVALFLIIGLLVPMSATAHVLEFDNGVGAILHIDPQDDPIAGQQTSFYFEFRDKASRFNARACDCTMRVLSGGEELYTSAMAATAPDVTSAKYTFPDRGVYQLEVSGTPRTPEGFNSFDLSYTVRVDKGVTNSEEVDYATRGIYIITAGIILLILFLFARHQIVYNVKYQSSLSDPKPKNKEKK